MSYMLYELCYMSDMNDDNHDMMYNTNDKCNALTIIIILSNGINMHNDMLLIITIITIHV